MVQLIQTDFDFTNNGRSPELLSAQDKLPVSTLELESQIDTKRYQYWSGASDNRYICTVFKPQSCPSVKTAVYIAVYRAPDGLITPLAVGYFNSPFISGGKRSHEFGEALNLGANEIHLHLLADDPFEARQISEDLESRLFPSDTPL